MSKSQTVDGDEVRLRNDAPPSIKTPSSEPPPSSYRKRQDTIDLNVPWYKAYGMIFISGLGIYLTAKFSYWYWGRADRIFTMVAIVLGLFALAESVRLKRRTSVTRRFAFGVTLWTFALVWEVLNSDRASFYTAGVSALAASTLAALIAVLGRPQQQ